MAKFLRKLDDGVDASFADIGQYLTSHPLSEQRVSDVSQRASRYGPYRGKDQPSYDFMRQKLRVLSRSPASLGNPPSFAVRYAKAYGLHQRGRSAMVVQTLKGVAKQLPEVSLLARAHMQLNQHQQAIQILQGLLSRYPAEESLIVPMAEALIGVKQYERAWQIMSRVRLVEQTSLDFLALRQEVARLSGRLAQAYLSVAERNIRIGEYRHALTQLKLALRVPNITAHDRQSVQRAEYRAQRFKKR
jgi:predicted Zn-dependent protease